MLIPKAKLRFKKDYFWQKLEKKVSRKFEVEWRFTIICSSCKRHIFHDRSRYSITHVWSFEHYFEAHTLCFIGSLVFDLYADFRIVESGYRTFRKNPKDGFNANFVKAVNRKIRAIKHTLRKNGYRGLNEIDIRYAGVAGRGIR